MEIETYSGLRVKYVDLRVGDREVVRVMETRDMQTRGTIGQTFWYTRSKVRSFRHKNWVMGYHWCLVSHSCRFWGV